MRFSCSRLAAGASSSAIPIAQSLAYAAAFFCLVFLSIHAGAQRPALRDLLFTCVGVGAMTLVLLPMREWTPGVLTLGAQIIAGASIMMAFIMALNVAGLRPVIARALAQIAGRFF